ncbi:MULTISPECIES: ATP-binding protein [Acidianus]|uniref:CTU1/ATPBD3 family protein MJ1478 n=1 Tax=Candidatus Acidianus copahuensis TaxID=1160895 RepID=A0A031LIQ9_9CREN|nr:MULTISPECIES: ATP-binding protein [Acidianus]EZQ02022.1 CTU1/ATPBD3 family protein MJ1478 [Candidatus Acidianus copahuensis]NON61529.1 adenine nucleotide alpha hydrolase family protein [Acidianus sp. RZ1]
MVRCTKCDKDAVIRINYANLYLCRDHLLEWMTERVRKVAHKYDMFSGSKRIAVAVSGGKDSTSLLHLLKELSTEFGFSLLGVTIDLGISGNNYSSKSVEYAIKNFEMLNVEYRVIDLKKEFGFTIDQAKRRTGRPVCSTCGLTKRYIMEKVAKDEGCDTLATGHNLNDIAQFLLNNYYNGDLLSLARLRPVSPAENGYIKKVKPLFLISEKETMTYAIVKGFPFIYDSCPHTSTVGGQTQDKIRRSIEEIDDKIPGFMISLVENFENKIRPLMEDIPKKTLGKCKICGMPTNNNREICSFCATKIKMSKEIRA